MADAVVLPRMFACEKREMRLTASACAKLWNSAIERRPAPWEGRAACVGCLVGARHAGKPASPVASYVHFLGGICSRCLRPSPHLINGARCVSCYNRHLEALRGKNGKGGVPRLSAVLHDVPVAISARGVVEVVTVRQSTGATEAVIDLARRADTVTTFGWGTCWTPLAEHLKA